MRLAGGGSGQGDGEGGGQARRIPRQRVEEAGGSRERQASLCTDRAAVKAAPRCTERRSRRHRFALNGKQGSVAFDRLFCAFIGFRLTGAAKTLCVPFNQPPMPEGTCDVTSHPLRHSLRHPLRQSLAPPHPRPHTPPYATPLRRPLARAVPSPTVWPCVCVCGETATMRHLHFPISR